MCIILHFLKSSKDALTSKLYSIHPPHSLFSIWCSFANDIQPLTTPTLSQSSNPPASSAQHSSKPHMQIFLQKHRSHLSSFYFFVSAITNIFKCTLSPAFPLQDTFLSPPISLLSIKSDAIKMKVWGCRVDSVPWLPHM